MHRNDFENEETALSVQDVQNKQECQTGGEIETRKQDEENRKVCRKKIEEEWAKKASNTISSKVTSYHASLCLRVLHGTQKSAPPKYLMFI